MTPEPTSIPQERSQMVKVGAWILEAEAGCCHFCF